MHQQNNNLSRVLFKALPFILWLAICVEAVSYGQQDVAELRKKTDYKKGDDSLILLFVRTDDPKYVDEVDKKAIFFPQVDRFSRLQVPGSGLEFRNMTDVYIWAEIGDLKTEDRYYKMTDNNGTFVPFWTLVIQMKNGKIEKLHWDESCSECSSKECIDHKTCGLKYSETDECKKGYKCDMTLYVAWVGTDVDDEPCQSLNYIPSKFSKFSLSPAYRSASGMAHRSVFDRSSGG